MSIARRRDGKFAKKDDPEVEAVRPTTALPGPQNPFYHESDDKGPRDNLPNPELEALREQNRLLKELLDQKQEDVQAQREAAVEANVPGVGPSGLPAGLYPERPAESTGARVLPRGVLAHEVLEMERLEAEQRALDNISRGLPPVPPPLPPGTVTATKEEFVAQR